MTQTESKSNARTKILAGKMSTDKIAWKYHCIQKPKKNASVQYHLKVLCHKWLHEFNKLWLVMC